MRKLGLVSVLALAAALSGAARAEDDVVNYLGVLNPAMSNQSASFNTVKDAGAFHDIFNFTFSAPAGSNMGAANGLQLQFNAGAPNVDFTSVMLNGVAGTIDNTGGGGLISIFFAGPVLGNVSNSPAYQLDVFGSATAGATYSGSLNVSMVPEPGTTAMLLAGVGVIGFVARRRR